MTRWGPWHQLPAVAVGGRAGIEMETEPPAAVINLVDGLVPASQICGLQLWCRLSHVDVSGQLAMQKRMCTKMGRKE